MSRKNLTKAKIIYDRLYNEYEGDWKTQEDFAKVFGINSRQGLDYRKNNDKIDVKEILRLFPDVNKEWLLKDDFDALKELPVKQPEANKKDQVNDKRNEYRSDPEFVTIPFYPNVRASAGFGLVNQDEEPLPIMFRSVFVRRTLNSSPSNLFAMKAKGNSMFPEIQDGDLLVVDRSKDKVQSERPYVVVQDEQVSVKYVRMLSESKVKLISENKSFGDQEIQLGNGGHFRILGEVKHIQRTLN